MKKKILVIMTILVIVAGYMGSSYYRYIYLKNYEVESDFKVDKGETLYGVLKRLGIERNVYLKVYMHLHRATDLKVEVGNYKFDGGYNIIELLEKLKKGRDDYIKITIPEGFTLNKIAERLSETGVVSRVEFEEAMARVKDFYYPVPKGVLEGYFFPDTYFFSKSETGESVVKRFLDRFLEVFPPEEHKDPEEFYKELILASIIEKEAGSVEEMKLVSSVFHNRMKKGMKLQSCATIAYLFDYEKDYITYKDLKIESVYNTYKYSGLPPTPIANPGEQAIKASGAPIETKYFYFVLQKNGKHQFSKTYEEHLKAQKREGSDNGSVKIRVNR